MLSNIELKNLSKIYAIKVDYIGYKDTMPNIKSKSNYGAIINIDNSNPDDFNPNGSHWTCLIIKNNICIYFDSFGLGETIETMNFINKQNVKHYGYNNVQIQDIKDDHCGYYCIALLLFVKNNYSNNLIDTINNFIDLFDKINVKNNKKILLNFLK